MDAATVLEFTSGRKPISELPPGVRGIKLTQGQWALVDERDWESVRQFQWRAMKHYKTFYAMTGNKSMHRLILGDHAPELVDHRDRNGLHNRRVNLREATPAQNMHNRSKHIVKSSHFKGVCWNKNQSKWAAYLSIDGKRRTLGFFHDELGAALAYNEIALATRGEFACINDVSIESYCSPLGTETISGWCSIATPMKVSWEAPICGVDRFGRYEQPPGLARDFCRWWKRLAPR